MKEPTCRACAREGRLTAAAIVDHVDRHGGDETKFFNPANLQSLCKPHHDGAKQKQERIGFSAAVDASGWPIDPKHPGNRPALTRPPIPG